MTTPLRVELTDADWPTGLRRLLRDWAELSGLNLALHSRLLERPTVVCADRTGECAERVCCWLSFGSEGARDLCDAGWRWEAALAPGAETLGWLRACSGDASVAERGPKWLRALAGPVHSLLAAELEADSTARELVAAYDQLAVAYELGDMLRGLDNERDLAAAALDHISRVIPSDASAIMAQEAKAGPIRVLVARGVGASDLPTLAGGCGWLYNADTELAAVAGGVILSTAEIGLPRPKGQALLALVHAEPEVRGVLVLARGTGLRPFRSGEVKMACAAARQTAIAIANTRLRTRLRGLFLGTVRALAAAVDAKDTHTRGHSQRVAELAHAVGRLMELPRDELERLQLAALLHDVGKIAVSTEALQRPGPLAEHEWGMIREHPTQSAAILGCVPELAGVVEAVRCHHERLDGSGYPEGLRGDQIPVLARIVAVCDAYDAMISPRPYRQPLGTQRALAQLKAGAGIAYDVRAVEALRVAVGDRALGEGPAARQAS